MVFRILIASCSVALMAGCTSLSTPYLRPDLPAGPSWPAPGPAGPVRAGADQWWTAFGDPNLTMLVGEVVVRNNDVFAAALRAQRARLQADLAARALFPKLSGSLATSQAEPLRRNAASTSSSSASVGVSYEVDLWGRLSAQRDAAAFEADATAEDYEAARLATIGMAIETYFRIAHANQSIATAEKSLAYVREIQNLVRKQAQGGAVSDLEMREIEQTVETQAARMSELLQARLVQRNVLAVLLNGAPNPVPEPQRLPRTTLPAIAAGLPAELLARRPDLRAAEARLRGALRGADSIRAGFYPQISLTGGLGTSSDQLISFIANPVATVGAGAVLSFLNVRDMKLAVGVSRLQYEETVAAFRTTLLAAFADVANALGARANHAEQARRLHKAFEAAREVEKLTEAQYRAGAITLRAWLDSQERRRTVETALADVRLAQFVNEATLFRALGGSTTVTGRPTSPIR
ncbi:efflux transporter outer membrane subunit [Aquibium microcysteis]|uniref:efflux transporter outer membrane subunit n=1 Tax=Aquibium microcysteis TaxID=675281 RepID=UPI00165D0B12|nr:efflux transporter outer membrane subunit [Aquibium microcysteis]